MGNRDTNEQQLWLIECASPLMIEVPRIERLENYEELIRNKDDAKTRRAYKEYKVVRIVIPMFNNALVAFKERNCVNKSEINREKKIILHEATLTNGDVLYHIVDDL